MSIEHSTISEGSRHGIANWEVASTAAMGALTVSIADIGKVAHVLGGGHYVLVDVSPSVWEAIVTSDTLGLENVDNTSDADKPVSALQAAAISDGVQEAKDYADSQDVINLDAAKDYADALSTSALRDCGNFDASGGAYPSTGGTGVAGAIVKGNMWRISVAGTLPTGVVVSVGDWVRALIDTPGNTQANWSVSEANLGYVPLRSINSRTAQDAAVVEYILENLHKLYVMSTDCVEATGRSPFYVTAINGAITYPAGVTGMTDATGIWQFTGSAHQSQLVVSGNKNLQLSSEPLILVASFSTPITLAKPYICLSLQANSMFGDTFYGTDMTDGVHITIQAHDGYIYYRTMSGGVATTDSDTNTLVNNTRCTLIIVATSTSIKYYLNGTLRYTHTTNIPTVALAACFGSLDHAADGPFVQIMNLDLFQVFRLYKTTPRSLGIPSITY